MTLSARMFLWGFGTAVAILVFIVLAMLYGGSYNVAASDPHTSLIRWALNQTVSSSVQKATENMSAPESFTDEQVAEGAVLFADSCAHCHGAPGVAQSAWSRGMLPQPPDLAEHADHMDTKEAFWFIQNGLKFTGMPAFSGEYSEDELWSLTAFVTRLNEISPEQYAALTAPEEPEPAPAEEPAAPESTRAPQVTPAPAQGEPVTARDQPATVEEEPQAEQDTDEPAEADDQPDAAPANQPAEQEQSETTTPADTPQAAREQPVTSAPAETGAGEAGEPVPEQTARTEPADTSPVEAEPEAEPADAPPAQAEPETGPEQAEPAQADMSAVPGNTVPIPPRMETMQTVADESKLEPSLRPLPPAPNTESQWPAQ